MNIPVKFTPLYWGGLILLLAGCSRPEDSGAVIARVGKAKLTREAAEQMLFERALEETDLSRLVSRWVKSELLYQAALREDLHKDQTLKKQAADYYREMLGAAYLESRVGTRVAVTHDQIKAFYEANLESFYRTGEEIRIHHYAVPDAAEARRIYRLLQNPGTGEERQELQSRYPVEALLVTRGTLIQPLDEALFNSRVRERIVGPLPSGGQYHVVEVLTRYQEGTYRGLDEVYDEVRHRLYQQHLAMHTLNLIDSLHAAADIEINLENIHP